MPLWIQTGSIVRRRPIRRSVAESPYSRRTTLPRSDVGLGTGSEIVPENLDLLLVVQTLYRYSECCEI